MAVTLRFRQEGVYGQHRTVAILTVGQPAPFAIYVGVAKCRRGDAPNKAVGRKLALRRAVEEWRVETIQAHGDGRVHRQAVRAVFADYFRIYEPDTVRGRQEREAYRAARAADSGLPQIAAPTAASGIPPDPLAVMEQA